ncbi:MAG: DMT family transporter [Halolamina sp.]
MSRYRNFALFLFLAAIWGSAFMAIKAGLPFFPPVLFAAVRYDIAGVIMLAYAAVVVDDLLPRTRGEWALIAVGAVFLIAGYHAFLFIGEQGTTSAAAAVIVSLSPVLTTGFARLFLPQERLSVVGMLGLGVGLLGVAILALGLDGLAAVVADPVTFFETDVAAKGLVFAATLSFAFGSVLTRRLDADLDIEVMEGWSMLLGAGLMHVVSVGVGESLAAVRATPTALAALAYLSVVSSALGFLVYFDLHERLGPVEINLVSYVAPVFAAVSGWLVLGEIIDAATVVGFCCILLGFLALKRRAIGAELSRVGNAHSAEGD